MFLDFYSYKFFIHLSIIIYCGLNLNKVYYSVVLKKYVTYLVNIEYHKKSFNFLSPVREKELIL